MADRRPPRFASDERETVMELWRYHRESFLRKVADVSDDDARRRFVATDTTLLWLANHMAASQHVWIVNRFAGSDDAPPPAAGTMAAAAAACDAVWHNADAVIDQHDFDDLCRHAVHGDTDLLNLRWVVVHLLEETARHAGHADIIRELIDGTTGR